jgi:hypothetical protein
VKAVARRAAVVLAGLILPVAPARAHEGPPYPVLVDRRVGPYEISVWADPDVGTGTFFVVFDLDALRSASDPTVALAARPAGGPAAAGKAIAHRQRDLAYRAELPFDREGPWVIRLEIDGARGRAGTEFQVTVTQPGYGRWDLLVYLAPFLLLAGLWATVALRRRRMQPDSPHGPEPASTAPDG